MIPETTIQPEVLALNAKLNQKKNAVRKELASKGILERGGVNQYDRYKYFSEAQYKLLFTELFSKYGLELTVDEIENLPYQGAEKMPFGRTITLLFTLTDIDTGFFETSKASGEGMDKGDKAGYKAYTGALKYYLANTFMVATGDDAVNDDGATQTTAKRAVKKASPEQIKIITAAYTGDSLKNLLGWAKVESIDQMPMAVASDVIKGLKQKG